MLALALAQLVLQGLPCCGLGRSPPNDAPGDAVEVPDPAASHPVTAVAGDPDRTMVPECERGTGYRHPYWKGFPLSFRQA